MPWPLSQDYNEAIQSPASNFADPDLRRGEAVANAMGIPMPCSGNFADVYQVRCPDGKSWAVKCFTRESPGLRERYAAISRHLRNANLPFMVDFTYLEQGIRVLGRWYPVLKMQWVEGLTLNQFVKQYAEKPVTLEALLQSWARMAKALRAAQIGHGDLQHGNVLLVPGSGANSLALKLIDYDGMWVPALAGTKSGEVGHPSYQHPQRIREGTYSIDVDRFPLLLIATALRALKAGGRGLWDRYDNGDNLLFKETDLRAPQQSALFRELQQLADPATAALLVPLLRSLSGGLASAPALEEVMPDTRPAPVPTPPRRPIATATAAAPLASRSPWDFAQPTGAAFDSSSTRPPPAKTTGVPRWAWAGVIALLIVALATAAGVALVINAGQSAQTPDNRVAHNESGNKPAPSKDKNTPPQDSKPVPQDSPSGAPEVQNPPPPETVGKDVATIQEDLGRARSAYATELDKAKAALLLRYDALLKAYEAGRNPQATLLRDEMKNFQSESVIRGRDDLEQDISRYFKSIRNARSALGAAFSTGITDYTKLHAANEANHLLAELAKLAPDAPLVSLESIGRPGQFVAHADFLGHLTRIANTEDRTNSTFEMVPGLANRDYVSFRSLSLPDYYIVHGDFRVRLQKQEGADGYSGTFKRVNGLAGGRGVSFESVNYPGFYIHAREEKLFLDKYDGSTAFQFAATFTVTQPQFMVSEKAPKE